jgi:glycosyltransferase, group 2 family
MQITVLMPVYNAEQYLHDSIGSLLAQTSKDWKLICVDDGSTDSSLKILREYENREIRIKVLVQENAGPAVARARAIEIADTEYVSILDSDDAYSPDYIEKMLKRAEETDADCIVPDVEFGYGNTKKQPNRFMQYGLSNNMIIESGIEAFAMTIPWKLHGWQMIRTSLAKEYYIVQQVCYSNFNSDEYITRLLYLKSRKVALCSAVYKYRIDPNSITRKPSLRKMDYLKTNVKLLCLAKHEKIPAKVIVQIYNDYYVTVQNLKHKLIPHMESPVKESALKLLQESRKQFKEMFCWKHLKNESFRTKVKFLLFLLKIEV